MTKEELEKEIEEYLENKHCKNVCTYNEIEECKKGIRIRCTSFNYKKGLIVNFAEPREKRIEELEKENAKAKEIIKDFLLWENSWHEKTESKYALLKRAEDFIKE